MPATCCTHAADKHLPSTPLRQLCAEAGLLRAYHMLAEVGEACLQRLSPKARGGMQLLPYVAGKGQLAEVVQGSLSIFGIGRLRQLGSGRAECELLSPA